MEETWEKRWAAGYRLALGTEGSALEEAIARGRAYRDASAQVHAAVFSMSADELTGFLDSKVIYSLEQLGESGLERPTILAVPHFSYFVVALAAFASGALCRRERGVMVGEETKNRFFSAVRSFQVRVAPDVEQLTSNSRRGLLHALRLLARGGLIAMMPDAYLNLDVSARYVRLFDRFWLMADGLEVLAKRSDADVVMASAVRQGEKFLVTLGPRIRGPDPGCLDSFVAAMERLLLSAPEEWCYWPTFTWRALKTPFSRDGTSLEETRTALLAELDLERFGSLYQRSGKHR